MIQDPRSQDLLRRTNGEFGNRPVRAGLVAERLLPELEQQFPLYRKHFDAQYKAFCDQELSLSHRKIFARSVITAGVDAFTLYRNLGPLQEAFAKQLREFLVPRLKNMTAVLDSLNVWAQDKELSHTQRGLLSALWLRLYHQMYNAGLVDQVDANRRLGPAVLDIQ